MKAKEYLLNKNYVINETIIRESKKKKISFEEFVLLIYFINSDSKKLDVETISNRLDFSKEEVLSTINSLIEKKLVDLVSQKDDNGKLADYVSLDVLETSISDNSSNKSEVKKNNIYSIFEKEFGRTISSMEYEIINTWIDNGFSEDLITAALKEAVYNGVSNLRYIDKILFEWKKKGFKTSKDVSNYMSKRKKSNKDLDLFDFDWLKDETK